MTKENPLDPTHKSKGVFFLSSASSLGRGSFYDDKDFDKKPETSANLRLCLLSPHAAGWCSCFGISGVLIRLIQEMSAKEKKKALFCGYSKQGSSCAHDRSAYIARA